MNMVFGNFETFMGGEGSEHVMGMHVVVAWNKLHVCHHRRAMGRMFRVHRECMYPKPVKDLNQLMRVVLQ